ncbi:PAS domain S-box protein, partial [bacterium]|nr:PAS domain S-box protein [bacterium]
MDFGDRAPQQVPVADVFERWQPVAANGLLQPALAAQGTACRRRARTRRREEPAVFPTGGITPQRVRCGAQQIARERMARRPRRTGAEGLDDQAREHDVDLVARPAQHAQVVRDEQQGEAPFAADAREETLRREALIWEQMHDGVMITDLVGNITGWNPAAELMFGYSAAEILGRKPSILRGDSDNDFLTRRVLEEVDRQGRWSGE